MRLKVFVLLAAVSGVVATINAPTAEANSFRATHVTKSWVQSRVIRGQYSTSFSLTSTAGATGYLVPPNGTSAQNVYACATTGGGKYSDRGKAYAYRTEYGCGPMSFSFNPVTWTATATGDLASRWYTYTQRKSRSGRWVYTSRHDGHSIVRLTLSWKDPGAPVYGFSPYPAVASIDSYGYVERPAKVAGTIRFRGIKVDWPMASQPGGLRIEDRIGADPS